MGKNKNAAGQPSRADYTRLHNLGKAASSQPQLNVKATLCCNGQVMILL